MSEIDTLQTSPEITGIELSTLKNKLKEIDEIHFSISDHTVAFCVSFIIAFILTLIVALYFCFKLKLHHGERQDETPAIELN